MGRDPARRIICASYGSDLAIDHANACRAVMRSAWYRDLFPNMQVDPRKDTETELRTTNRGYRLTTTVGGSLTGRGGSIIIIDDPMAAQGGQPDEVMIDAARLKAHRTAASLLKGGCFSGVSGEQRAALTRSCMRSAIRLDDRSSCC